jgi:tRNA dimethylallyltransferase
MMSNRELIVIVGPTGAGKTDLSLKVAAHFGAPILSTDSRQIYRELPIGTAQPDGTQLQQADHYFIASHSVTQEFNCGAFEVEALRLLERLFVDNEVVVAVGGSGLYVKALCEGLDDLPQADESLRRQLAERLATEGVQALAEELRTLDPLYYEQVDRQNPARVLRALEVCLLTGRPYSEQRHGANKVRNFTIRKVGVTLPREELYARIDHRVDLMMQAGLEAEARNVYAYRHSNALQTVGYKELFDYFDGRITLSEAVELIKRNSRRYAKRQLTWFRRDADIRWFSPLAVDEVLSWLDAQIAKR